MVFWSFRGGVDDERGKRSRNWQGPRAIYRFRRPKPTPDHFKGASLQPSPAKVACRDAGRGRSGNPDRVAKLTPQAMSQFQAAAQKQGMKATTLAPHMRHIMAALRWGERQALLTKAPAVETPKLPRGQSLAKHRPPTAKEFDRMLAAVPKVRRHGPPVWQRLLRGLWLSGLRPSEAVALDWNNGPFVLDTTGKRPAFRIEAKGQESRRAEIVPCTPDFATWILAETPEPRRVGKVFNVIAGEKGKSMVAPEIGRVLSAIGCKAGVVVGQTDKPVMVDGKRAWKPVKLFAGAHDLRRAFCSRWGAEGYAGRLATLGPTRQYSNHDELLRELDGR